MNIYLPYDKIFVSKIKKKRIITLLLVCVSAYVHEYFLNTKDNVNKKTENKKLEKSFIQQKITI